MVAAKASVEEAPWKRIQIVSHLYIVCMDHSKESIHHYDNTPLQYTANFNGCKNDNFLLKKFNFLIFAQNIGYGYRLEKPHTPLNPSFTI